LKLLFTTPTSSFLTDSTQDRTDKIGLQAISIFRIFCPERRGPWNSCISALKESASFSLVFFLAGFAVFSFYQKISCFNHGIFKAKEIICVSVPLKENRLPGITKFIFIVYTEAERTVLRGIGE
jgi:hypothetical protein